jgi:peptidoglycan hydrolase-like protein with peptidoglycan-binding domain
MRRVLIVLSTVLGLGVPLIVSGPAPTASAAPDDIIAIVVDGIGNGHGRGMSQWGAYGWAVDQGKDWRWILDHYYSGTTSGTVGNPGVKVRLTALDGAGTVGLISHGAGVKWGNFTFKSMQAVRNGASFDIFGSTSISCAVSSTLVVPDGPLVKGDQGDAVRQVQQFLTVFAFDPGGVDGNFGNLTEGAVLRFQGIRGLPQDGEWRIEEATAARAMIAGGSGGTFTKIGTAAAPTFTTTDSSNAASVLGLCRPNGSVVHYRGSVEVSNQNGSTRVVNNVASESYLRGVVPREISASWAQAGGGRGAEAVRAQAVAARSYGLQQNRYPPYATTCDTQACQVYGGAATRAVATGAVTLVEDFRTDQAITATAGVVRRWPNGSVVSTEFSASNGPRTAGGVFAPRDDVPGDGTSRNPNHRWTRILDADDLATKYGLGTVTAASMTEAAASQYRQYDGIWFNDIVLSGSNGRTTRMNAWDFRRDQGLPSPGFTVRVITRDTLGANVAMIGDSVGESTKDEFRRVTDGTFASLRIDTLIGRFVTKTPPSPSGVQAANGLPTNLDLVIVELGYNPSNNMAADIDAMMDALRARGTKRVVWVNMAEIRTAVGGSSYYAAANAALREARSRWSNLIVADWNAASAAAGIERARWILSDGVHLSTTGQAQFALWMRQIARTSTVGESTTPAPTPLPTRRFQPNQRIELPVVGAQVVGTDGVARTIPAGASAVAVNIAAVTPSLPGFITVWPCDVARPDASNLNYVTGGAVANSVIAPVGASGKVCFYSNQETDFLVDITGWFSGSRKGVPTFVGATPRRVIDTRNAIGGPKVRIPARGTITIPLAGAPMQRSDGAPDSIPTDATAVAMNVTAVGPSQAGFFTVWPCGAPMPVASNVNFTAGSVVANGVVTSLGARGAVCLYSDQQSDVLVDVLGWFGGGSQPPFVGAVPSRLVDTRNAIGGPTGVITPSTPKSVPVRGVTVSVNGTPQQVPVDASAVALNVTMVEARAAGFATVWPCGTPMPDASNVNFGRGGIAANGVIAPIGAAGSVCIYTSADAHLIVDIAGWFTGGATPAFTGNIPRRLVDTRNNIGPTPL